MKNMSINMNLESKAFVIYDKIKLKLRSCKYYISLHCYRPSKILCFRWKIEQKSSLKRIFILPILLDLRFRINYDAFLMELNKQRFNVIFLLILVN